MNRGVEEKMKIKSVLLSAGLGGYYFDDLQAIKDGAKQDGLFYVGKPVTPGFSRIRQPAESISVMLVLEDGQVTIGDCIGIQYSGAGGREPILLAEKYIPLLEKLVGSSLVGRDITSFKELSQFVDSLTSDGQRLHSGIRYGLSQAVLDAVAKTKGITMAEVIADEYGLTISDGAIPTFQQAGDDRYIGVDKMILKKAPVIPHGLFNSVEKIGQKGEKLIAYVKWVKERVRKFGEPNYLPDFLILVYGTIGDIFNNDIEKITQYLDILSDSVKPFCLMVGVPMLMKSKEEEIAVLASLKRSLFSNGIDVEIAANEFCNTLEDVKDFVDRDAVHAIQIKAPVFGGLHNTIEAILYCKKHSIKPLLGGTCASTDVVARIIAQVALATQPSQMSGRPGMGVDEAMQIQHNEMYRTLALIRHRLATKGSAIGKFGAD